jgi:hypothetical protein
MISPANSHHNGNGNSYATSFFQPASVAPLEIDESFDLNFDISDTDMEAMMMNATQDFWASFPGEVGYS